MDYEKKYKEAIERMKSWARGEHPECFSEAQKAAEFVFPELAESNDEKIRKRLLTDFSMLGKEEWGGLKVKDICAWLEQQKEYVSADFDYVWERTDCESLTSSLDKYSEEAIKKVCHAWYDKGIELERKSWLEKQKHTKKDVDIESMVKAYKKRIVKQDGMENNPLIDMCLTCFKHGVESTLGELDVEQILANSAKTCKNEQKSDKCDGCNNVKGCVTCVDGDQWTHYKEVEQKPIKMWHDVSEVPDEMQELLVEWESPDATWHNIAFYDAETNAFRHLKQPINNVTRWAYVNDILTQSVTKKSEQVPSLLDLKLMDCPLSVKTISVVKVITDKAARDVTLGDLVKCTKEELLGLRNFGKTSLKEIEVFLAEYGLKLKGE